MLRLVRCAANAAMPAAFAVGFSLCALSSPTRAIAAVEPRLEIEEDAIDAQALADVARSRSREFAESLTLRRGDIDLPDANAELQLGPGFAFLDAEDTRRLLEDAWGNPPGASADGAIVPSDFDPFGEAAWLVVIQYEEEGYVSDADASEIDYDELLETMKAGAIAENEERVAAGYPPIELVGWAEPPRYNDEAHQLYWAKEVVFGDDDAHTLNYNIRALGRRGVLVLNAVGAMSQLPVIRAGMQELLPMISFEQGSRYVDFDPDVDEIAAYGIGALVAGKVAAKVGLLAKFAPLLLGLKKFGIVIVVVLAGVARSLFGRKRTPSGDDSTPVT